MSILVCISFRSRIESGMIRDPGLFSIPWIPGPGSSPGCQEGHRGEESLIYSRVGVTGIIILLWVAGRIIKIAENISSKMIRLIPFHH